jgi:3'5'-cyclic nucleotide phosphodiesterase
MESNGERNRIQVSQKTADLIVQGGKGHWLIARSDKVHAKGKGALQTYWCNPIPAERTSSSTKNSANDETQAGEESEDVSTPKVQTRQKINWIVDLLERQLKDVVRYRSFRSSPSSNILGKFVVAPEYGKPIDEATDVLLLPKRRLHKIRKPPVALSAAVSRQLREYVESIIDLYQENAFHNVDHCNHVVMSTVKLLDRVATVSEQDKQLTTAAPLDPLTQFAVVIAALIHDVDHAGVSNAQLVLENATIALEYGGKSVAEQNSIDRAWSLLMESRFDQLQACIFSNNTELHQFRQILVHMVLATDLFDKDLQTIRAGQWNKVFGENAPRIGDTNLCACIVLQLIIQASDVSHTMQHFTVYKKWNMCLLEEMYQAYKAGRLASDPTVGWYDGELWFFDNYVIPLAEKLQKSGAFGVAADEFLDYAKDNRLEWESNGRRIVAEAEQRLQATH